MRRIFSILYPLAFCLFSVCIFGKEYVFIGVPNTENVERIVEYMDNPIQDSVSFIVPECQKEEMGELLRKFGKNIKYIFYIPYISKDQLKQEIDIFDTNFDKIATIYKRLHQKLQKVGSIISASEYTVYPVARLRTLYNIPGLKCTQGIYFRDKTKMKDRLNDNLFKTRDISISLPKYAPLNEGMKFDHVLDQMKKANIDFPIILKPRSYAASVGIYFITNKEHLNTILQKHKDITPYEVNEFIDSKVIHINGVVQDGKVKFISSFEYGETPLNMGARGKHGEIHFEISGKEIENKLYNITSEVVYRLGMEDGVFHLELFKDKEDNLTFLEIAARQPGGEILPLVEVATGVNLQEFNFLIDMNSNKWKKLLDTKLMKKPKVHALYLTPFDQDQSIKITSIDISSISGVNIDKMLLPKVGEIIKADNSFYKHMGAFVFSASNINELRKAYESIRDNYLIKYTVLNEFAQAAP